MKPIYAAVILLTLVGLGALGYMLQPGSLESGKVISQNGLHWHATLKVKVKGEYVEVPVNMGLGAVHNPVHTHDDPGVIHMEFGGRVMQDDLMLQKFLNVWEPNDSALASMTVNGVTNTEFGNYHMKDGDIIELLYN